MSAFHYTQPSGRPAAPADEPAWKPAPVRDHATSLPPGQERPEIEAWLAFADAHLQRLTESVSAPKLPTPPKPSGDDLKPFLGHWSPYGPRSY
ncbi:hypothetical protein ACFU76_05520 [Streptomyces sp. NPDC057539]|uniref:hypothetical protein n=1 Tax=Streptomyces sp. NPDC057539 TaxID=3346159 RepID=UPI0036C0B60A